MWNFSRCNLCYSLREDKKLMKSLKFRRDYKSKILPLRELKKVISDAADLNIEELEFLDEGEPFLEYKKLKNLIKFSRQKFKKVIIYTNGFFANSIDKAYTLIKPLKDYGLSDIFVSWDFDENHKLHQSFIPEENVVNLIKASKIAEVNIHVMSVLPNLPDKEYDKRVKILKKKTGINFRIIKSPINFSGYIYNLINKLRGDDLIISFVHPNKRVKRNFKIEELIIQKNDYIKKLYFRLTSVLQRKNSNCNFLKFPLITTDGFVVACTCY